MIQLCTNCGGNDFSWQTFNQNASGVVDGRLCSRDIICQFVLGCNECSETVRVVFADEIASRLSPDFK